MARGVPGSAAEQPRQAAYPRAYFPRFMAQLTELLRWIRASGRPAVGITGFRSARDHIPDRPKVHDPLFCQIFDVYGHKSSNITDLGQPGAA
jgi:hypothetical protein